MQKSILLAGLAMFFFCFKAVGQSPRNQPQSFRSSVEVLLAARHLPIQVLPQPDLQRVQEEDAQNPGIRVAVPLAVDANLENAGTWIELPDGGRLWQLKLHASGALGLIALYDAFYIPEGANLFMFSPDRKHILGPFTSRDNTKSGKFVTGLTPGSDAIIEYYEPKAVRGMGQIHLFRVDYAYHRANLEASGFSVMGALDNELGFGTADSCQVNVACNLAADTAAEKRAVCRIVMILKEGTGFCTGNMLSNTAENALPYLISAFHCQDGYTPIYDLWRFDFKYQSDSCTIPGVEPAYRSMIGCTRRAGYRQTDFLLLELEQRPPGSFQAFLLGWNRSGNIPARGVIYHHPRGDIKKVAMDKDPLIIFRDSIDWNNGVKTPPNHHFNSRFDTGSFDIGSSGAALLNENGQFVGQLHGGYMACRGSSAYFGRLFYSWEGGGTPETRLKDWLDPLGLSPVSLEGMENLENGGGEISGIVHTEGGAAIVGAEVQLVTAAGTVFNATTDVQGYYQFSAVPYGERLEISVSKNDLAANGCSTADLIKVQKHILGIDLLETAYQWIAADVNLSSTISTQDLIQIRKVVLGIDSVFKSTPAWHFIPVALEFPEAPNPFIGTPWPIRAVVIQGLDTSIPDLDFIGIKYGDVNGSAAPDH